VIGSVAFGLMIGVGGFFLYLRFNSKKKEKTEAKYIEPALTATEA